MQHYYVSVSGRQDSPKLPVNAASVTYWVEVQADSVEDAKEKAVSAVSEIYAKFGVTNDTLSADECNAA